MMIDDESGDKTATQKLIEKFKDEPFSVIDENGTILNKTHLSSMGYATHVPYSVVGIHDLLSSINKLAHEHELFKTELERLDLIEYDYYKHTYFLKEEDVDLKDKVIELRELKYDLEKEVRRERVQKSMIIDYFKKQNPGKYSDEFFEKLMNGGIPL